MSGIVLVIGLMGAQLAVLWHFEMLRRWCVGELLVSRVVKRVSRMVNPIISICFRNARSSLVLPDVRSTLRVGERGNGGLVMRIRRRVNRGAMHAITVSDASNLRHKVGMFPAKNPVAVPMNRRVGKHLVGMINSSVSKVGRLGHSNTCSVRHSPPGFRSLAAMRRILFAKVGIVSLLRPCSGKNGVNLFNKTKINGAMLVVRLVGGVTGGRGNFSMFTKIKRHAHRNGSLLHRVVRSNMVHCKRTFGRDVRGKR